jgi:hypothetical protein
MPRTFAVVLPFLTVLILLSQGRAVAGLLEGVSGKMVLALDPVAAGLRQYRRETDPPKRIKLLKKLAPTGDPRVAVVLGETLFDKQPWISHEAAHLLADHYCAMGPQWSREWAWDHRFDGSLTEQVTDWWKYKGDDLRDRAKQLSR